MKRAAWVLLLALAAAPSWAATKLNVGQLKEKLVSFQQSSKEDKDVADWLKGVELTEELTGAMSKSLATYTPGPLASVQLAILEGRSAFQAPPASELPSTAAPDAAAQKAILAKATDYMAKVYAQNPHLAMSKATSRFQDDVQNTSSSPGLWISSPNTFTQLWETSNEPVEIEGGIEKAVPSKTKYKWGQHGEIPEGGPGPSLNTVIQEATAGGKIEWLRWETVNGKQIAVFSFTVEKKKSHYDVNYCCFPSTEVQSGIAAEGTFKPLPGEIQSLTSWKTFKKAVGYHGEIFIDPEKGTIVRAITIAEMKPSDFVHMELIRTDYGPVVVDGKEYEAPVGKFTINEVVPKGDDGTGVFSVRHGLINVTYRNYRLAGTAQK